MSAGEEPRCRRGKVSRGSRVAGEVDANVDIRDLSVEKEIRRDFSRDFGWWHGC
jgi:hypothetical protein